MKTSLAKQYENKAKEFNLRNKGMNRKSIRKFRELFENHIMSQIYKSGEQLLDLGCGPGDDLTYYQKWGFKCIGVDSSKEMCDLAQKNAPNAEIANLDFVKSSLININLGKFKVVTSKWTFQTVRNYERVWLQVLNLLQEGGFFCFLVVHPLRQFLEKKKRGKNYFKQEVVASKIFNKMLTVYEPSHTITEYLSYQFFRHFELICLYEGYEFPAAEQIGGDIYPTYLIVIARKK